MDHHHLMIHRVHQNRYNQQLKEIFEIQKQMMLLVIILIVDMYIVKFLFEYLDHDNDR
jgi:hypothetical protein